MDSNQGSVDAAGVDAGIASADTSIEGTPPALVPDVRYIVPDTYKKTLRAILE